MTAGLETFAKVRALHDRTDSPGEKAAAMLKMQTLARKAGMSVDEAVSTLDALVCEEPKSQAKAAADSFNDFFNSPEIRACMAEREAERLAKCRELLKRYGTEDAVFAETEREAALRKACEPLTVWDTRPDWRGCYTLGGWGGCSGKQAMPASVREAVTKGWPWPETVAAAWNEYEAAEALDSDRYAFEPAYTPHRWIEARSYALEDVLDTLPARSLNDIRARLSWMEHLSRLECQWTHEGDLARLAILRADIERMGERIREQGVEDVETSSTVSVGPAADLMSLGSVKDVATSSLIQSGQEEGYPSGEYPLRRSNADKRRDVLALLNAEISGIAPLSDREIARRAGVSPQTVGNIRRAMR